MTPPAAPPTLALTEDQRATLRALIEAAVPGARVAVFGSRATGRARPFSDVDLLILQPTRLTWQQRTALLDALEASDLPFRVDVVEADHVPPTLWPRLRAEAVPL